MDNIATQLTQLQTIKQNIATAIEGKGGTVGTGFASYATAITNLPDSSGGGGSAVFRVSENPSIKFGNSTFQTIPSNIIVDTLTQSLFYQCQDLTSIAIPNGVTSIPSTCFHYCQSLASVTGGQDVSVIEAYGFSDCGALLSMPNFPNLTYIGDNAFQGCYGLTGDVSIPSAVTYVGQNAFEYCSQLESVTFNDCSCEIGYAAFANCSALESVDFGDNVYRIGTSAFAWLEALTSISTLPAKYHLFGDDLTTYQSQFRDSPNIQTIDIPGVIELIPQDCFCGCNNATTITIGEGITEIGQGAFYFCSAVEELTLPSTLTYIGPDAFVALESLTQLIVLAETPPAFEEGAWPFDDSAEYPIYVPDRSYTDYLYDWGQYLSDSTRLHRMRDLPSS